MSILTVLSGLRWQLGCSRVKHFLWVSMDSVFSMLPFESIIRYNYYWSSMFLVLLTHW